MGLRAFANENTSVVTSSAFVHMVAGMTSDLLIGAQLVTADGEITYASESENQDLFWALRGGGNGNFGVVTRLDFQLVPKPNNIVIETITYPGMQKKAAVQFFFRWQKNIANWPDELTTAFQWFPGSEKGSVDARVVAVYLGTQVELDALLTPLTSFDAPIETTKGDYNFLDAMVYLANCRDRSECIKQTTEPITAINMEKSTYRSRYVARNDPLTKQEIGIMADWIGNLPRESGIGGMLLIDSYGGAISRVPPVHTAFPHRDMLFVAQFIGTWTTGEQHEQVNEWINGFYAEMIPHMSKSAYINYNDLTLPRPLEAYYGVNLQRLKEVKGTWDPYNEFTHQLGIPLPNPN